MVKSKKGMVLLKRLSKFLNTDEAIEQGRTKRTAFVRKRELEFRTVVGMLLNSLTRSLEIELGNFFEYVLGSDEMVTKQAFSKARQDIRPDFLRVWRECRLMSFTPREIIEHIAVIEYWR